MRKYYLQRIYRLKLLLLGTALALVGILTSILADDLSETATPHLFVALLSALADVLVVTGAIGIAVDFFTGKDKDAADSERLRDLLKEAAPDSGMPSSPASPKRRRTCAVWLRLPLSTSLPPTPWLSASAMKSGSSQSRV